MVGLGFEKIGLDGVGEKIVGLDERGEKIVAEVLSNALINEVLKRLASNGETVSIEVGGGEGTDFEIGNEGMAVSGDLGDEIAITVGEFDIGDFEGGGGIGVGQIE